MTLKEFAKATLLSEEEIEGAFIRLNKTWVDIGASAMGDDDVFPLIEAMNNLSRAINRSFEYVLDLTCRSLIRGNNGCNSQKDTGKVKKDVDLTLN